MSADLFQIPCQRIDGSEADLSEFRGKVLLIVNVASKCGFTPQYKGLEELHQKYRDRGFEVLGFPCNQFLSQEPGDASQISEFCELNFGVTFPLFAKIDVNGDSAHPLYVHLKEQAPGMLGTKAVKWNFTKFLVNRDGEVVKRISTNTEPEEIIPDIEALL